MVPHLAEKEPSPQLKHNHGSSAEDLHPSPMDHGKLSPVTDLANGSGSSLCKNTAMLIFELFLLLENCNNDVNFKIMTLACIMLLGNGIFSAQKQIKLVMTK